MRYDLVCVWNDAVKVLVQNLRLQYRCCEVSVVVGTSSLAGVELFSSDGVAAGDVPGGF